MTFAKTANQSPAVDDFLAEYDEDIVTRDTLPYCQIQTPPNLTLEQINKLKCPYGLFISAEQAELVEFRATDDYLPTSLTFGEGNGARDVSGFLTRHVRMAIIHKSQGIEVQERTANGWKTLGLAYKYGKLTPLGQRADNDKEGMRFRTRYLIVLLDRENTPLHTTPLTLGLGRGTGGTLGEEVRQFRSELEVAFFQSRGLPKKALSDFVYAHAVLDVEFGLHKGQGRAPFVCPVRRLVPSATEGGGETTVSRRERTIKLIAAPIRSLLISKNSEVGTMIGGWYEEYQEFATRTYDTEAEDSPTPEMLESFAPGTTLTNGESQNESNRERSSAPANGKVTASPSLSQSEIKELKESIMPPIDDGDIPIDEMSIDEIPF